MAFLDNAVSRNWTATLWPATYNGFPFYFERDEDESGRDVITHTFPNSDQWFNEDLGQHPRHFSGTAYVTGGLADVEANALIAVLLIQGPGILTVPILGPVIVRNLTYKRVSDKDRFGFIAFDLKFVQESLPLPLFSVPYLGALAYAAVAACGTALLFAAPAMLAVVDEPEFVAAAAAGEVLVATGAIGAVAASYPVAADVGIAVSGQLDAITTAAPLLLDPIGADPSDIANLVNGASLVLPPKLATTVNAVTAPNPPPGTNQPPDLGTTVLAAAIVQVVGQLGSGMTPSVAQGAMVSLLDAFAEMPASGPPALSINAATAAANVSGVQQLVRVAALIAWAAALIGRTYTDRPSGVTARAEAAERFEIELNNCPGAEFADLYLALENLQSAIVRYLTKLIANLAPVVTIEAKASLPSLVWAWKLYQDPTRCVDLVLRNEVIYPSLMPLEFSALTPGYAAPGIPTAWPPVPL